MSLTIHTNEQAAVIEIEIHGRLVMGQDLDLLRDEVRASLARGTKEVTLDLADVTHVDSCGLGALIANYTTAKSHGAGFRLVNASSTVRRALRITKLDTVIEVCAEESLHAASR